ncbi:hypothetical protein [uncultured Paraglaciecola sp.]|mgnify:CR=1 FL=1|uniref:hypothetical protein n=1 Tax=uncultured Paraglaciecola sp. TaxID=1765024 RepID=UPI0025CB7E8C|nr:hypothetical protein [uncultured Paraglaciecola sp.]
MTNDDIEELANYIERELYRDIGPLLFGTKLYTALGFPSAHAFRQACSRNTMPVEVFNIENRRGKFALSRDVAKWLATQKINNIDSGGFIEKKI